MPQKALARADLDGNRVVQSAFRELCYIGTCRTGGRAMFKRRIGPDIHGGGGEQGSAGAQGCPDIWELENGDVAVIGLRRTTSLLSALPAGAGCGPDEEIVVLPRSLILGARKDLSNLT